MVSPPMNDGRLIGIEPNGLQRSEVILVVGFRVSVWSRRPAAVGHAVDGAVRRVGEGPEVSPLTVCGPPRRQRPNRRLKRPFTHAPGLKSPSSSRRSQKTPRSELARGGGRRRMRQTEHRASSAEAKRGLMHNAHSGPVSGSRRFNSLAMSVSATAFRVARAATRVPKTRPIQDPHRSRKSGADLLVGRSNVNATVRKASTAVPNRFIPCGVLPARRGSPPQFLTREAFEPLATKGSARIHIYQFHCQSEDWYSTSPWPPFRKSPSRSRATCFVAPPNPRAKV